LIRSPLQLAGIDERIFVEILEQPWDKLVGVSRHIESKSVELGNLTVGGILNNWIEFLGNFSY
jgi:hypothetical protein